MFNNIGEKIKKLAKFVCWFGIAVCVISGIAMIIRGSQTDHYYGSPQNGTLMIIEGIILSIVGPIASWLGSLILFGFGELIARTVSIDQKLTGSKEEKKEEDSDRNKRYIAKYDDTDGDGFYRKSKSGKEEVITRIVIGLDQRCCICGVETAREELKEWNHGEFSFMTCEDCRCLLQNSTDESCSGRKREKARDELKQLLESGKVCEDARPHVEEFIRGNNRSAFPG